MHRLAKEISALVIAFVLAGCAPASPAASTANAPTAPAAPKVLNIVGNEPIVIGNFPGVRGGGGGREGQITNEYLTIVDPAGNVIPRIAQETISVDRGTWRLNADGTMDTTWKIRPNVRWQDGQPFTTDDLLFTYTAYKDPALPSYYGAALDLMTGAEVVDPLTFVVHWSRPYFQADLAPGLDPLPKHLLEPLSLTNKDGFDTSSFFRQEFIGTGPYRIKAWVEGSHLEFERNDFYYLGRPPLDGVILHFVKDKNTVAANVLAGALDVVFYKDALDTDAGVELKNRWAGNGNDVTFIPVERLISLEMQFRADAARPQFGATVREVRQAMLHAIDRQALVDGVTQGLSPIAASWITPQSKYADAARSAVPHYDYDVNRAQQLLAGVGWTRAPDGGLVHQQTGERFDFDLWNRFQFTREQTIVADYWKAVGINTNIRQYIQNDRELQSHFTGGQTMDQTIADYTVARLRTADIASEANRYVGRNVSGYSNPRFDELLDSLRVSIDSREQTRINVELAREAFTDLAELPLYFQVTPLVIRAGWSGSLPGGPAALYWDLMSWDKRT